MRIVADAQRGAALQDYARRAFNLDREDVEWILEPANFKFLAVERADLNGAAVVVRQSSLFSVRRPIRAPLFGNASEPGRWPAATKSGGRR